MALYSKDVGPSDKFSLHYRNTVPASVYSERKLKLFCENVKIQHLCKKQRILVKLFHI